MVEVIVPRRLSKFSTVFGLLLHVFLRILVSNLSVLCFDICAIPSMCTPYYQSRLNLVSEICLVNILTFQHAVSMLYFSRNNLLLYFSRNNNLNKKNLFLFLFCTYIEVLFFIWYYNESRRRMTVAWPTKFSKRWFLLSVLCINSPGFDIRRSCL